MKKEITPWSQEISQPVSRIPAEVLSLYSPERILNQWHEQLRYSPDSQSGLHYILDLDENLFDSATHWVNFTNTFLRIYMKIPTTQLPTEKAVMDAGGPSAYYPRFFSGIFPSSEVYEKLADEMRHRFAPNRLGKAMHPNIPELIQKLSRLGVVLGGLTARPATHIVREATRLQLSPVALDVIFKPVEIPLSAASTEKLSKLELLTANGTTAGLAVLIDDSISTAKVISGWNKSRNPHLQKPIIQVLNGLGPLTAPKLAQNEIDLDQLEGVFLMKNWTELELVIQRISRWLNTLPQA